MPSKKILQEKQEIVKELSKKIGSAKTIILADARGLSVEQDTILRNELRKSKVEYKVVKNTLTFLAAKENGLEGLEPFLKGPTAIALSSEDIIAPAKVMVEFEKKFEKLELKTGVIDGKIIDLKEIKALAELPPKEVLIAKALGGFNAPIAGLVNVLNANIRGLVMVLSAISKQKANA